MLWVLAAVLAVVCAGLIAYMLTFLGAEAAIVAGLLALVPLTIVLFAIRLIDRWEPEPRGLVAFAVAWGAIAAVAIALA
ncbi:MAG TPA: PrsW family intramembrane metalloprotease, partial [Microbacterium sp.]|nr:PrsW family intramembrane metalloprotease [Microbacterium sp.]